MNEQWAEFIGKRAKVIFQDGTFQGGNPHYGKKEGVITIINETHVLIKTNGSTEAIQLSKVLRMEVSV